jgi:hypothetical protein
MAQFKHIEDRPARRKPIWVSQQGEQRPMNADAVAEINSREQTAPPSAFTSAGGINPMPPKMPIEGATFDFKTPAHVNVMNKVTELEALLADAREEIADLKTRVNELQLTPAPVRNYIAVTNVQAIKKDGDTASVKGVAAWGANGEETEITVDLPIAVIKEVIAKRVGQPKARKSPTKPITADLPETEATE